MNILHRDRIANAATLFGCINPYDIKVGHLVAFKKVVLFANFHIVELLDMQLHSIKLANVIGKF